jgi:hypothetical protein
MILIGAGPEGATTRVGRHGDPIVARMPRWPALNSLGRQMFRSKASPFRAR